MSRVNVDFVAFTDPRFAHLAKLMGFADHDHARSKVEYLWLECTKRESSELPQWLVEAIMGDLAPEALIASELASWRGGRGDSKTRLMRISGAEQRCLWKGTKREQSSKGGKARASTASRVSGRFQPNSPAEPPAQTSAPSSFLLPPQKEKKTGQGQPCIEHFTNRFSQAYEGKRPSTWGRHAPNFHKLAEKHGTSDVIARIDRLFDGRGPDWIKHPFDPGTLVANWDRLVTDTRAQPKIAQQSINEFRPRNQIG